MALDPDIGPYDGSRPTVATARHPFPPTRRRRWPRVHWASVAAVAGGGFAGGVVRYVATRTWPSAGSGFPWSTFVVNTAGAFVLALLLVLVLEVLRPSMYLRPALGTGFCGALTTFSSVAADADRLAAHGHADIAAGYVSASLVAGLAAASFGIVAGRSVAASRKGRTR